MKPPVQWGKGRKKRNPPLLAELRAERKRGHCALCEAKLRRTRGNVLCCPDCRPEWYRLWKAALRASGAAT